MSLDEIRLKIDEIDRELVPLLKKRMECSLEVAKIKRAENLPVYHPVREKQILDKVEETAGEDYGVYVRNVYRNLMAVSRSLQNDTLFKNSDFAKKVLSYPSEPNFKKVICQGTSGAFSHAAALKMFPDKPIEFSEHFEDVFKAVENDETVVGILPVENTTAGSVNTVYDLILKYSHFIVRGTALDITQNLLTVGDTEAVKTVYSHPHALKQCKRFIESHGLIAVEYENTALAAKYVAELDDPSVAAIGSEIAAESFGLKVAEKAIQDNLDNMTRFVAISKRAFISPDSNTISLAFSIPHENGSLSAILTRFADCGLNLTKLESRPLGHGFEYKFYIDFSGNIRDERTLELLSSLESELSYFVFLGNYLER